ncbi:uncharacterized protein LOC141823861 [Curcuma longa]|uniref:uncharacterized protein LOC141823861 n=1 Tax=Curcuma longa TaxID=136217 RepID=UPI003D9DD132
MVRVYTLHRRDAGTMALIVLRDTRWRGDRAIIATMEMDLSRGTQMTYVIPDLMISIDDFSNHLELSIQTHGYNDWQGGTSNLLITRMMLGRLTNTSFTNFSYNVQHVADYLASRGVIALPGNRFSTEELQNQRWVLRPTLRRNPMAPTRVQSRALMDGSVSLQFEGYTAVPEQHPYQVNENDEEIHSPEQEILAVLTIEEVLPIVEFKRLSPNSTIPTRATYGAAGYDLHIISNVEINAGGRDLLGTGLAMAIPEGYYGRIAPRSGVAWKKGIHIGAGVIDSDYRGEIKILVFNLTYEPVQFKRGEAIAQIIFTKISTPTMMQVPQLPDTRRGTSGFGSTSNNNQTSVNQVPPEDRVSIGSSLYALREFLNIYVKGTIDYGLLYSSTKDMKFFSFNDSDWAGSYDNCKSITGYVFYLGNVVFTWSSKKQSIVALLTCEAKYIVAASYVCHAIWLKGFRDLKLQQEATTKIYVNNKSTIALAKNPDPSISILAFIL